MPSRDISDLPPILLSQVLWDVYLGVPLKDWLQLKTICSTWASEIDTLVTVRDPLDDAKGQTRMRHPDNGSVRPIPAWYCARLMPPLQYARYLQRKILAAARNGDLPFARYMSKLAFDLTSQQKDQPSESTTDNLYNENLYRVCEAYATDPLIDHDEYILRWDPGSPPVYPLLAAAFLGRDDILDTPSNIALLESNSKSDSFKHSDVLDYAARGGDARLVAKLLARGFKPSIYSNALDRRPSLKSTRAAAAFLDRFEVVQLLSQDHCTTYFTDTQVAEDHHNSILAATEGGHQKLVEFLLSCRGHEKLPMPEVANDIIRIASRYGFTSLLRLGMERGADVNAKNARWQSFPLVEACSYGREEVVELLLSSGASLYYSLSRLQPADEAAAHGHVGTMKLLIGAGLRINQLRGNPGWMAHALRYGQVGVMRCLIDAGYSFEEVDKRRLDYMIAIAARGGYSEALVVLAQAGVDIQAGVRNARDEGQIHILQALKEAGFDSDA